jgi:hypothetical protein
MRAPRLIRFMLLHAAIGIAAGWLVVGGLLATNTGGLADLVFRSSVPALPLVMLMIGTAITFGSAAMGAGIMMLPYDGDGPRRRRRAIALLDRIRAMPRRGAPALSPVRPASRR